MKKLEEDTWYPSPRYLLRKSLLMLIFKKEKKGGGGGGALLEVGYGSGDMLCTYAKMGIEVWGYDFSELAYRNASKRVAEQNISNIYVMKDKEAIRDKKFDYIVACEVLEHIEDDGNTLKYWNTLLNKNGKLVISVPAGTKKFGISDEWAGHYRRYEKQGLIQLLNNNKFAVELCYSYPFPVNIILDLMMNRSKKIKLMKRENYSKEKASKESGIVRESKTIYKILSNNFFMYPFIQLQKLFLNMDLGSGYIIVAQKLNDL